MFHNQTTRQETSYRTFFDWGRWGWHLRLGLGIFFAQARVRLINCVKPRNWPFTVRMRRYQSDDALCIVVLGGVGGERHNLKKHMYWKMNLSWNHTLSES